MAKVISNWDRLTPREKGAWRSKARIAAMNHLADLHPDEFHKLYMKSREELGIPDEGIKISMEEYAELLRLREGQS